MDAGNPETEAEIVRTVKLRYRVCNYLFTVGALWMAAGSWMMFFHNVIAFSIEFVGLGVFTTAFAVTLAIYRCPLCDHYLSKFRPDQQRCGNCGVRVR